MVESPAHIIACRDFYRSNIRYSHVDSFDVAWAR